MHHSGSETGRGTFTNEYAGRRDTRSDLTARERERKRVGREHDQRTRNDETIPERREAQATPNAIVRPSRNRPSKKVHAVGQQRETTLNDRNVILGG